MARIRLMVVTTIGIIQHPITKEGIRTTITATTSSLTHLLGISLLVLHMVIKMLHRYIFIMLLHLILTPCLQALISQKGYQIITPVLLIKYVLPQVILLIIVIAVINFASNQGLLNMLHSVLQMRVNKFGILILLLPPI